MASNRNLQLGLAFILAAGSAVTVGCGGGGASGAGGYRDLGSLTNALEAPTGTVDTMTAPGVAKAFEESNSSGLGGIRQKLQEQSGSQACSGGGSISVQLNETVGYFTYNNCVESDCTMNGNGSVFLNSSGEWNQCLSYDISAACADSSLSLSFSGCLDGSGEFVYLVEYEGETFRVTGSYSGGSGELTITGANGSYTCTYSNDTGSCTGDGGETFSF